MGNLFGGLARPGSNRGTTGESIPVVRDKATESKKETGRYNCTLHVGPEFEQLGVNQEAKGREETGRSTEALEPNREIQQLRQAPSTPMERPNLSSTVASLDSAYGTRLFGNVVDCLNQTGRRYHRPNQRLRLASI